MKKIIISVDEVTKTYKVELEKAFTYGVGTDALIRTLAGTFKETTGCDEHTEWRLKEALGKTLHQFEREALK